MNWNLAYKEHLSGQSKEAVISDYKESSQHLLLWRNSDVKKDVFRGLFSAVEIMIFANMHFCKAAALQM